MRFLLLLAALAAVVAGATEALGEAPRVLEIEAASLYEAGLLQGRWAKERIQTWVDGEEMSQRYELLNTNETYATLFAGLKRDNGAAYPHLVEELRGIADGAGLPLDKIWVANLLEELDSLLPRNKSAGHCSDFYGRSASGSTVLHGHNEVCGHIGGCGCGCGRELTTNERCPHDAQDWNEEVKPLWYYVVIKAKPGANFTSCAGLACELPAVVVSSLGPDAITLVTHALPALLTDPGAIVGWAVAWNEHGIFQTQNTLFPGPGDIQTTGGLATAFVQRNALCPAKTAAADSADATGARSLAEYARRVNTGNWAAAASLNVVDLNAQAMGNIEALVDAFSLYEIRTNYSHFNMFKHLDGGFTDLGDASSEHRQARADQLPAPRSPEDIAARLGDVHDQVLPLYRKYTLTSSVLDGATGKLSVWIGKNPAGERGKRGELPPKPDVVFDVSKGLGTASESEVGEVE